MKNYLMRHLGKKVPENALSKKAKEYWNTHMNEFQIESAWTSNPLIVDSVYKKMTKSSNKFWLKWVIEDYLSKSDDIKNVLSICCGSGDHEIIIGELRKNWNIDAFDISDESIRAAKQKANAKGIGNIDFFIADVNSLVRDDIGNYDLILSSGALHHVKELENLFSILQQSLNPAGYFVVNEFCGPSRHQWTQKQIDISNKLANAISQDLKGTLKNEVKRPTIEEMINHDPSESIRSSEIPLLLRQYFNIKFESNFGGTILHNLYPLLNHEKFRERNPQNDSIINLLIKIEDILIDEKVLESDFKFFIARNK